MHSNRRLVVFPAAVALALLLLPLPGCAPGVSDGDDKGGTGKVFNNPPVAKATADVTRGIVPLKVRFDSSRSTDSGGYIVSRLWDFGDGATATEITPTHVYNEAGQFSVTLTVTDNQGATDTDSSITIFATQAPVAIIQADNYTAEFAPATISFDGSQSYDPDGSVAGYLWSFGDGATASAAKVQHTFSRPGNFRVRLTVTDNFGVKSYAERVVVVGIGKPVVSFRVPDETVTNIALAREAPLWISATYEVEPGTPYMISAGLDRDRDPCDAQAILYDARTGDLLHHLLGAELPVRTAAFSPDGILALLAGDDGMLRLYDANFGEPLVSIDSGADSVNCLAFAPDGNRYVYGCNDGGLVIRHTQTGEIVRTLQAAPNSAVLSVAFSSAAEAIASGSADGNAVLWNTAGVQIMVLNEAIGGHSAAVNAVAFSPTDYAYLATGSADRTAKLWQIEPLQLLLTCTGHTDEVTCVAFSPGGGLLATGSLDQRVALWNAKTRAATPMAVFESFDAGVTSLAFSPDGTGLLVGCANGSVHIIDLATQLTIRTLEPCTSAISSACYNAAGSMILLGVAAQNGIPLDTLNHEGADLNVRVPAALDLTSLTDAELSNACGEAGCAPYYLWVQLDTDITEPVRAYARATVQVLESPAAEISDEAPVVPLVENQAVIVAAATPTRQVFSLPDLEPGDQLKLSLATMPGYGRIYDTIGASGSGSSGARYSVLVLDGNRDLFVWYQNPGPAWDAADTPYWCEDRVSFSAADRLIVERDGPYYLVLDGCTRENCGTEYVAPSVVVEVVPGAAQPGESARQQRIYLNFNTAPDVVPINNEPVAMYPLDVAELNAGWGAGEKDDIVQKVHHNLSVIFAGYDVVLSEDPAALTQPYTTVYFCGGNTTYLCWADCLDPRNQRRDGTAYVFANAIKAKWPADPDLTTTDDFAAAFANVAAQQIGLMVGLRNTIAGLGPGDVMDPAMLRSAAAITGPRAFINGSVSLNAGEQGNGGIGMQNARNLLLEVIGPG